MTTSKSKSKISSDADKALAKAGKGSTKKGQIVKKQTDISVDSVIAEKDEVKNAEERQRQKIKRNNQ